MINLSRANTSLFGRWWWTVDKWTLVALGALILIGTLLNMSASPAVAERIGTHSYFFVYKQLQILPFTIAILLGISLLDSKQIQKLGTICLVISMIGLVMTLMFGTEIKGARRWISLGGFSLQPSEFLKPTFTIVLAWLLSTHSQTKGQFPGKILSFGLLGVILFLMLMQPDLGMSAVITVQWFALLFITGLQLRWIVLLALVGSLGLLAAYSFFPHVTTRVDKFLSPGTSENYQVEKSLEAFTSGGIFGVGPGEGHVKDYLPDAHADTIFAVAGEEFGLIPCLITVMLFCFIVLRGLWLLSKYGSLFAILAGAGIYVQFGIQVFINLASTLNLIPTKGMTLPFVSYGGSSAISLGLAMGVALALTRKNDTNHAVHKKASNLHFNTTPLPTDIRRKQMDLFADE